MGRDDGSAVIRRGATDGSFGALALRVLAAAALGTIGFYLSVGFAYLVADTEMPPAEALQSMFPDREYLVVLDALVSSALIYLVIDKGGLYRTIARAGAAGWIALFPCAIALLTVVRGVAIDLIYFPIHYEMEWSPASYAYLAEAPLQAMAYLVDGVLLFAISALLAKAGDVSRR